MGFRISFQKHPSKCLRMLSLGKQCKIISQTASDRPHGSHWWRQNGWISATWFFFLSFFQFYVVPPYRNVSVLRIAMNYFIFALNARTHSVRFWFLWPYWRDCDQSTRTNLDIAIALWTNQPQPRYCISCGCGIFSDRLRDQFTSFYRREKKDERREE